MNNFTVFGKPEDPVSLKQYKSGGRKVSRIRKQCECTLVSTPAALSRHQEICPVHLKAVADRLKTKV